MFGWKLAPGLRVSGFSWCRYNNHMNTFEQEIEHIFSSDNSDEHLRNIWPQDFQYSRLSVCFLSLLASLSHDLARTSLCPYSYYQQCVSLQPLQIFTNQPSSKKDLAKSRTLELFDDSATSMLANLPRWQARRVSGESVVHPVASAPLASDLTSNLAFGTGWRGFPCGGCQSCCASHRRVSGSRAEAHRQNGWRYESSLKSTPWPWSSQMLLAARV